MKTTTIFNAYVITQQRLLNAAFRGVEYGADELHHLYDKDHTFFVYIYNRIEELERIEQIHLNAIEHAQQEQDAWERASDDALEMFESNNGAATTINQCNKCRKPYFIVGPPCSSIEICQCHIKTSGDKPVMPDLIFGIEGNTYYD